MNNKEKLILSLMQIENLVVLSETLEYRDYIQSKLYKLKYELKRQLSNCPSDLDKQD